MRELGAAQATLVELRAEKQAYLARLEQREAQLESAKRAERELWGVVRELQADKERGAGSRAEGAPLPSRCLACLWVGPRFTRACCCLARCLPAPCLPAPTNPHQPPPRPAGDVHAAGLKHQLSERLAYISKLERELSAAQATTQQLHSERKALKQHQEEREQQLLQAKATEKQLWSAIEKLQGEKNGCAGPAP